MYDEPYKSVWLSEEGAKLSEELFEKLFAVKQLVAAPKQRPLAPPQEPVPT
jgi:hypothetical protein